MARWKMQKIETILYLCFPYMVYQVQFVQCRLASNSIDYVSNFQSTKLLCQNKINVENSNFTKATQTGNDRGDYKFPNDVALMKLREPNCNDILR